jgi:hypothetical protein
MSPLVMVRTCCPLLGCSLEEGRFAKKKERKKWVKFFKLLTFRVSIFKRRQRTHKSHQISIKAE